MNECACGCGGATKSKFVRGHHRKVPGAAPPRPTKPISQRLSELVIVEDGCWLWKLGLDRDGYGSIKVGGRTCRASRVSYEFYVGPVQDNLVMYALCGNRSCVRPDHLEPITRQESVARGESDPLLNFAAYYERRRRATHCPRGHAWDEENTRRDVVQRVCRACAKENARRRRSEPDFREIERGRNRELYAQNAEAIRARKRAWIAANKEAINARIRATNKARYERKKAAGICIRVGCNKSQVTQVLCEHHRAEQTWRNYDLKSEVPASYTHRGLDRCWLCGGDFTLQDPMWHDHLIPRSLGGPNEAWNLAPAHRDCNIRRSNTPLASTIPTALLAELAVRDFPPEYRTYLTG